MLYIYIYIYIVVSCVYVYCIFAYVAVLQQLPRGLLVHHLDPRLEEVHLGNFHEPGF